MLTMSRLAGGALYMLGLWIWMVDGRLVIRPGPVNRATNRPLTYNSTALENRVNPVEARRLGKPLVFSGNDMLTGRT